MVHCKLKTHSSLAFTVIKGILLKKEQRASLPLADEAAKQPTTTAQLKTGDMFGDIIMINCPGILGNCANLALRKFLFKDARSEFQFSVPSMLLTLVIYC